MKTHGYQVYRVILRFLQKVYQAVFSAMSRSSASAVLIIAHQTDTNPLVFALKECKALGFHSWTEGEITTAMP
uniref:Uncharacterized protein n=1 Tax=Candidatus Kentrum sp. FW TaxID=2126338 RepID=A0A450T420_9GAMM|nr:MAG: hypothetical protein BECKFW1821A_GA0114235_101043 [Candidatus Kentron sp. FW]VFJ61333.1 MAG: hypothetical protein BECKFW1821B_GA0114236_10654 [Candidatus Kentron sp. FW]